MPDLTTKQRNSEVALNFVWHESIEATDAEALYGDDPYAAQEREFSEQYMPDEITRDSAKRMHYAAYRATNAKTAAQAEKWKRQHLTLRDRIVVGNQKLIFRAVRRRMLEQHTMDDLIGDCYIVMIRAVAAFNPWMGIRFSTYAFTCLMRALARINQRSMSDRLAQSVSLELVGEQQDFESGIDDTESWQWQRLDEFFRDDHPLLSAREKWILLKRYHLDGDAEAATLEKVGKDLGISKERVRQVQVHAINKLRKAVAAYGQA